MQTRNRKDSAFAGALSAVLAVLGGFGGYAVGAGNPAVGAWFGALVGLTLGHLAGRAVAAAAVSSVQVTIGVIGIGLVGLRLGAMFGLVGM